MPLLCKKGSVLARIFACRFACVIVLAPHPKSIIDENVWHAEQIFAMAEAKSQQLAGKILAAVAWLTWHSVIC